MITNQPPGVTLPDNQAVVVERSYWRDLLRKRLRQWLVLGGALFCVFVLCGLFLIPQSYTATVSISMEQPSPGGAGASLAALAGLSTGGGSKKYTGVLRSRRFATEVEQMADLSAVYGVSGNAAIERLLKGIKVDDNASDGLMYISMTLPAPPRLIPAAPERRARIQQASAQVANDYVAALRDYLKNSDTDRDLAMLREADTQVASVQRAYRDAVQRREDFLRSLGGTAAAPDGVKAGPETPVAVAALQDLYNTRSNLMQQVKRDNVSRAGTERMVSGSLNELRSIPEEDDVLLNARTRYNNAVYYWEGAKVRYGDAHPLVVDAYRRMKLAEKYLHEQAENIIKGQTSEDVRHTARLAELDLVNRQIQQVQENLQLSRELAGQLKQYEAEEESAGKVLEEAETRYAQLKLQTVSAQNRMTLIDSALPPERSTPGLTTIFVASLAGALAVVLAWLALEYMIHSQRSLRLAEI
ncbi:MAG TPA: hypothetical protein VKT32_04410 [Chthonomonadaceae bacterium]|nr:hypothetical protein [Chthonomonadaceae bacterium]